MKTFIILFTFSVVYYSTEVLFFNNPLLKKENRKDLKNQIDAIGQRLDHIENRLDTENIPSVEMEPSVQINELKYNMLRDQLNKLEAKFDRYFLWGYGTLISLILAMLANGWLIRKNGVKNQLEKSNL